MQNPLIPTFLLYMYMTVSIIGLPMSHDKAAEQTKLVFGVEASLGHLYVMFNGI